MVEMSAALMSAGLDSLSVAELVNTLSAELKMDVAPTDLFDHPTLDSMVSYLSTQPVDPDLVVRANHPMDLQSESHEVSSSAEGGRRAVVVAARRFQLAGRLSSDSELRLLSSRAFEVNTHVPATRWAKASPTSADAGPASTYGSFASGDQLCIDRAAFGISVIEARSLDPQQRLVLHVGYAALRGGADVALQGGRRNVRNALLNRDIGVFVGVEASGLLADEQEAPNVYSTSGGALSITSGRLSYTLGLVGPCYSIDTACASALAALHACVSAVGVGAECEAGAATGTKVLSEASNVATAIGGMTSPHGRCHTFDRRADGYCRGEGCGAFLVSSLRGVVDKRRSPNADIAVLGSAVQ